MSELSASVQSAGASLNESDLQELLELKERVATSDELDFLPSAEDVEREIADMAGYVPSPEFMHWVDRYATVGRRNPYLWNWCRRAVEVTTLPCVEAELRSELCDTKTLGVMFDVLLDDIADRKGNGEQLEELLRLIDAPNSLDLGRFQPEDRAYAQFTVDVWQEIMRRARRYPLYSRFAKMLRYDYLQLCNVMRYSHLLNGDLDLLNLAEHNLYTPHNMHIMICSTFDLMCSPSFDHTELGKLREIIWNAQCMGRIGNLVTTWQREIHEGDFTSGVFARVVSEGDLSVAQLLAGDSQQIERVIVEGGHEQFFLRRWNEHRQFLLSAADRFHSFDVQQLVRGFERLICLHLGSRGRK